MSGEAATGTVNAEDDGTRYLLDELDEAMEVNEASSIIITSTDGQGIGIEQITHDSQAVSMEQIVPNNQQIYLEQILPNNPDVCIEQVTSSITDGQTENIEVISNPLPESNENEIYTEIREKSGHEVGEIIILQMAPAENNVVEDESSQEHVKVRKGIGKEISAPLLDNAEVCPFVCGICSEKFKDITSYYGHFKIHTEYLSAFHSCENVTEMSEKGKGKHGLIRCGVCNMRFPSICLIHDHMLNVENISDYRYHNYTVLPVYATDDDSKQKFNNNSGSNEIAKAKRKRELSPKSDNILEKSSDLNVDGHSGGKRQKANDDTDKRKATKTSKVHQKDTFMSENEKRSASKLKVADTTYEESQLCTPKGTVDKTPSNRKSANQVVLERNFEMRTRRRTYTMTKDVAGKEKETPRKIQKDSPLKPSETELRPSVTQTEVADVEDIQADNENAGEGQCDDSVTLEVREVKDAETVEAIADYLVELSQNKTSKYTNLDGTEDVSDNMENSSENCHEQKHLMAHANSRVEDSLNILQTLKRKQLLKQTKASHVQCDICFKMIQRKGLARHRVVHMQNRDYKCDICNKSYKSRSHLSDHIRIVHAEREHKCTACDKVFKTPLALEKHKNTHIRKQEIDLVTGQLLVQNDLKTHIKNNDPDTSFDQEKIACSICSKVILKSSLSKHILSHSNLRRYKCDHCDAAFKLQSHLKSHINAVHLKLLSHNCSICDAKFKTSKLLFDHKILHLDPTDKYYSPEIVAQIHQEEKDRDLRRRNHMPRMVECDICGKTINYKRLSRHRAIHNKSKDFPCDICHKKYSSLRYVYDHKLKVHTDIRTFCDICGQFFKGKGYLEKHRQIHGPRDKICTVCKKAFTTDFYLKMHMRTHEDKNAVTCDFCSVTLSSKTRLAVHMSEKHNIGEKRPCKYCFLMFPSRQRARLHERRVHEGFEVQKRLKRHTGNNMNIKQEQVLAGEEYHVILTQEDVNGVPSEAQIQIMTEKLEPTQEVTSVELINAATNSEIQETVTHAQLLDAVLKSSETQAVMAEGAGAQEEIVQHVVEIPESAEQVCALVLYPDGTYRLVNPDDISPDAKVVAEVATR